MITYIVKTLLCAAILFLIYFLFLEREKMYRFNRFYLLFSIVFSFGVSFITIKTASQVVTVNELIAPVNLPGVVPRVGGFDRLSHQENKAATTSDLKQTTVNVPVEKKSPLPNILLGLYLAGTAFFLFRFILNLLNLLLKVNRNKSVNYHGAKLVLANDIPLPYSFMQYIFLDREKFEQGCIEKEILEHELTHVHQKHSIDVLFVELIMVFAWINPLLFLYRKAIMLNHEYLADEAVINTYNDSFKYQLLLFHSVSQSNKLVLASPFNYLITKKRFLMMTKKTSQKVAIIKQIALIPLIAAIGFLFSASVVAQDNSKQVANPYLVPASIADAPQSTVNEYHTIISKYIPDSLAMKSKTRPSVLSPAAMKEEMRLSRIFMAAAEKIYDNKTDKARLEQLCFQMSKQQQAHQFISFSPKEPLRPHLVPTKDQFVKWKNPNIYGIWVNGWRVKNSALIKFHSPTEYAYYYESKMTDKIAKAYKYQIYVTLLTNAYYEKDQARRQALWDKDSSKYQMWIHSYTVEALANIDAGK